jgi:hypothetical protein
MINSIIIVIIIIVIIIQFFWDLLEYAGVATGVTDTRILSVPIAVLDLRHVCGVQWISVRSGSSASQQGDELHTSENLCIENKVRIVSISPGGTAVGWVTTYTFLCREVKYLCFVNLLPLESVRC